MNLKAVNEKLNVLLSYTGDTPEVIELKRTFFIFTVSVIPPVIFLTFLTYILDVPILQLYGWLLLGYYTIALSSFLIIKRYIEQFYYCHSIAIMMITFFIVIRQGGILHSGGILYSSLAIAVFAFVFNSVKLGITTSIFYILGIVFVSFLQPWLTPAPEMVKGHINLIFTTVNSAWISIYILMVIFYVFGRRAKEEKARNEKLQEIDDVKTRLFTNITHEFRTPLTIILGASATDTIENKIVLPLEGKGGRLEMIRHNATRLLRLVNQMMSLAKIESGNMQISNVQMNIIPYLAYLMDSCRSLAEKKKVKMHFLKNTESEMMDFDPDKMEDIILNLLYNAIKFTPPGGDIYMTVDTMVSPTQHRTLILRIRDTGIGIPANKWNMIFERFYQIEDKSAPVQEGSGIGLTLVKEYLKLMGGNIEVSSKVNEGTEFVLNIPITKHSNVSDAPFSYSYSSALTVNEWSGEANQNIIHTSQEPSDQHHTILIVEDNTELAHYLRSVISPHFKTELAINGQDGIEKAMETIPDLIVSDVMMPVKDGYELCDTLKKDYKTNHIPIILLTARADSESKIMGFQKGADDYISKPFQSKELLVRIRKMIEQREKLKLKYSLSPIEMTGAENHFISLDDMFIAEILQHLEKNYEDENFGIDELCSAMKISRVQLHRKLIALTGLSASHFINKFRLEKAVKLLTSTRNSVSEIAFEVGFHDSNYFSRVFSKVFGVSPGDFRKQKQ